MPFRALQAFSRAVGVLHQATLGELELDERGIHGVGLQHRAKRVMKVGLVEVSRGDVDRHARHAARRRFPSA